MKKYNPRIIEGIVGILIAEHIKNEIMPQVIKKTMKELKKKGGRG